MRGGEGRGGGHQPVREAQRRTGRTGAPCVAGLAGWSAMRSVQAAMSRSARAWRGARRPAGVGQAALLCAAHLVQAVGVAREQGGGLKLLQADRAHLRACAQRGRRHGGGGVCARQWRQALKTRARAHGPGWLARAHGPSGTAGRHSRSPSCARLVHAQRSPRTLMEEGSMQKRSSL